MPEHRSVPMVCACGCGTNFLSRKSEVKKGNGRFLNRSHAMVQQHRDDPTLSTRLRPKRNKPVVLNSFLSPGA